MCLFRYLGVTLHSNRTFFASLQRLLTDNSMSHTKPKHETTPKPGMGVQRKKRRRDTPYLYNREILYKTRENNQQQ